MAAPNKTKEELRHLLFEIAYEIDEQLSANNYFLAKIAGVRPEDVESVALETAQRKLLKILKENQNEQK